MGAQAQLAVCFSFGFDSADVSTVPPAGKVSHGIPIAGRKNLPELLLGRVKWIVCQPRIRIVALSVSRVCIFLEILSALREGSGDNSPSLRIVVTKFC